MLRLLFLLILIIHGSIHFIGFAKAFGLSRTQLFDKLNNRPVGVIWLITATLFILSAVMIIAHRPNWWIMGLVAVFLSQILIFTVWKEARYGSILNVLVLFGVLNQFGNLSFRHEYENDVMNGNQRVGNLIASNKEEQEIKKLPKAVQRYLTYTGAVNSTVPYHLYAKFNGRMRSKTMDWFTFQSEQHNYFDQPSRFFFMKAKMFGLTVPGYHRYADGKATMVIKLFGLIPVVNNSGKEMDKAETVTMFNDLCLMAPGALVDKRVRFEEIDNYSVKAFYTNNDITISAVLKFNDKGELIDFISDDRYDVNEKKQFRFSTPVTAYNSFGNVKLASSGTAVWYYPDGPFAYGEFNLKQAQY